MQDAGPPSTPARVPETPSVPASKGWQPASEFDQLKEVNAGAGRLFPIAAAVLVGLTFTAGSEYARDLVPASPKVSWTPPRLLGGLEFPRSWEEATSWLSWPALWATVATTVSTLFNVAAMLALIVTAGYVYASFVVLLTELIPSLPPSDAGVGRWRDEIRAREAACERAAQHLRTSVLLLALSWVLIIFARWGAGLMGFG